MPQSRTPQSEPSDQRLTNVLSPILASRRTADITTSPLNLGGTAKVLVLLIWHAAVRIGQKISFM